MNEPLPPKSPPMLHGVQHDSFLVDPPHGGQLLPQGVGVFVVDPHIHLTRRLIADHACVGLDVGLVHQLRVECVLEHQVCFPEPRVHVALAPGYMGEHVVDVRLRLRQSFVAGQLRVERRRAWLHCHVGIKDRVQLLVLRVDEQQCFLRSLLTIRGHRRHLLADEAHHIPGKHRHVPQPPAHQRVRQVGAGNDRMHPWHSLGSRRVDADNPRMRKGRAQRLAPEHPRQRNISGIDRLPGNLVRPLAPYNRLSQWPVWSWSLLLRLQFTELRGPTGQ